MKGKYSKKGQFNIGDLVTYKWIEESYRERPLMFILDFLEPEPQDSAGEFRLLVFNQRTGKLQQPVSSILRVVARASIKSTNIKQENTK